MFVSHCPQVIHYLLIPKAVLREFIIYSGKLVPRIQETEGQNWDHSKMPQVITLMVIWILNNLELVSSCYCTSPKETILCTIYTYRWCKKNNLCVLQAPDGRGSRVFESQRAPTTRAAAGELTEAHQIKKGSNSSFA